MKRVLVTGGTGFIGRNALAPLFERGYEVHAIGREPQHSSEAIEWHRCDLMDSRATDRVVADVAPTRLLHLAWYTEHGKFWSAPENLDWIAASVFLLRSFQRHGGRRAVLAGSCAEYAWNEEICKEGETSLEPATLYGVSKNALRAIGEKFAADTGLSFAWGRVFFLYGPHESADRLVPFVTRRLLKGLPVPCTFGEQERDFLHVEDTAAAFVTLLDSNVQGAVNIASGNAVRVRDVVSAIGTTTGRNDLIRFGELPERLSEPRVLAADATRICSELGWKPRWSLQGGLASAVDWWRAQSTLSEK